MSPEAPSSSPEKQGGVWKFVTERFGALLNSMKARFALNVKERKEQAEAPGENLFFTFLSSILESKDGDKDKDEKGGWLDRILAAFDDTKAESDAQAISDPAQRQRALDRLGNIRTMRAGIRGTAETYIPKIYTLIREGEFNVPPSLFVRLVAQESAFRKDAVSPARCYGLAQLKVTTAQEVAFQVAKRFPNRNIPPKEQIDADYLMTHPEENLLFGMQYLQNRRDEVFRQLRAKGFPTPTENDAWRFALASYNGGSGNFGQSLTAFTRRNPGEVPTWDKLRPFLVSKENREYADRIAGKINQYVDDENPIQTTNA